MTFDSNTAETIAPVLSMVGQEARLDPHWTCQMIEAVSDEILPDFYRLQRSLASTPADQVKFGLKLVGNTYEGVDDVSSLAHAYAGNEQLTDALYWIGKALQLEPGNGEYHRCKASVLERMGRFEEALQTAHEAKLFRADPEAMSADIDRIEKQLISQLRQAGHDKDKSISLPAYVKLLGMGRLTSREFVELIGRVVGVYAKRS